jgi:hypothetical protein
MMDKVQKPTDSEYYTPSLQPFRSSEALYAIFHKEKALSEKDLNRLTSTHISATLATEQCPKRF